jgi:putative transposase
MIAHPTLSVSRQCQLLEVSRASVYRRPAPVNAEDLRLMELISTWLSTGRAAWRRG